MLLNVLRLIQLQVNHRGLLAARPAIHMVCVNEAFLRISKQMYEKQTLELSDSECCA